MSVYVDLFHGRHSPGEELDGWGFEGPVLGPFPYFHLTYGSQIKVKRNSDELQKIFANLGIDKDGFTFFLGAFYGDLSVIEAYKLQRGYAPDQIQKRWLETQKILGIIAKRDFPLLVGVETEWVKIALEYSKGA